MLVLQVGDWPARSRVKAPASLWLAIATLYDDIKKLEDENLKSTLAEVSQCDLRTTEDALASDICDLRNDTLAGFSEIEDNLKILKGESYSTHAPYSNIGKISKALNTLENELNIQTLVIQRQFKEVRDEVSKNESSAGMYAVHYGKYSFASITEVGAWAEQTFKSTFPFGAFIDVYSVLQRVTS